MTTEKCIITHQPLSQSAKAGQAHLESKH